MNSTIQRIVEQVLGAAFYVKDAKDRIRNLEDTINFHLSAIHYIYDPELLHHWKNEVIDKILLIDATRIKPKSKRFKKEDIYQFLFEEPIGSNLRDATAYFTNMKKRLNLKYGSYGIRNTSNKKIHQLFKAFHRGLSDMLSKSYDDDKMERLFKDLIDQQR